MFARYMGSKHVKNVSHIRFPSSKEEYMQKTCAKVKLQETHARMETSSRKLPV